MYAGRHPRGADMLRAGQRRARGCSLQRPGRSDDESDQDVNYASTHVNYASTPVYDSLRAAVLYGQQRHAGGPPRHPDIYRQLCWEFGHELMNASTGNRPHPHRADSARRP